MAKKSFIGENPALRYISVPEIEVVKNAQSSDKTQNTDKSPNVHNEQYTHNTVNASIKETKSKRLNVLIRPSLYEAVSKVAHMQRVSVNEVIHLALEKYVGENAGEIGRYDVVYGEKDKNQGAGS